jgi:hypothetical protein
MNCSFSRIAGPNTIAENAGFELHVRSRKSLSYPQKPFDMLVEGNENGIGWEAGIRTSIPCPEERVWDAGTLRSTSFQWLL